MKAIYRTGSLAVMSLALVVTPACTNPDGTPNNTGTGALIGGLAGAGAGALIGGRHHAFAGALIGGVTGAVAGGLIGHMIDQDQQARLQAQSPQTWQTIQHNDQVAQQQAAQQQTAQAPAPAAPPSYPAQPYQPQAYQPQASPAQPAPAQPSQAPVAQAQPAQPQASPAPAQSTDAQNQTFTPITVDDIKALTAAGVKQEAITQEIQMSKSKFTPQQVAEAQQATPPVDPAVIDVMKNNPS